MARTADITFRDLPRSEEQSLGELRVQLAQLQSRVDRKVATADEIRKRDRLKELLDYYEASGHALVELVDPLFVAVRDAFNDNRGFLTKRLYSHASGKLKSTPAIDYADAVKVSLVLGLLADDKVQAPGVILRPPVPGGAAGALIGPGIAPPPPPTPTERIVSDPTDALRSSFSKAFFAAFGEMQGLLALADLTLSILEAEGDNDATSGTPQGEVETVEFARVLRCLHGKGINEREAQLKRRINECLDSIQRVGDDRPMSEVEIALPILDQISNFQIQREHVRNTGSFICAAMMDELKVFQVVDRLVEMAQDGTLATIRGAAGEMLYKYWKETPNRMSEAERMNFYALTIGIPGGSANGKTNREFNDLWIRFVSTVSSLVRQQTVDKLLQQSIPAAIGQQQVRKAARDLSRNLSAHGYGMMLYAAIDLQKEINKIISLLNHEDILKAFGAMDMWQVIDQVAALELGGARNTARYATLATCGAIITAWLANNVEKYNTPSTRPVLDLVVVTSQDPPTAGAKATKNPTDYDLVNACELWLADTATSEERIEQIAREPRESPAMTSKPIQIPAIAREMLEQAGLPGMSLSAGARR